MKKISWTIFAPWFLTFACAVTLVIIGFFLVNNINWYKTTVFDKSIIGINTPEYRFYAYHLHLSMIKRSIGLFSGFSIMFLGLGIAFYTLKENISIDGQAKGLSLKLVTASPGIIALIVGAYLVTSTIDSKDHFPPYNAESIQNDKPLDTVNKPIIPLDTVHKPIIPM